MDSIDKKSRSERDSCTKFITPALQQAQWDILTQIREEVTFTKGLQTDQPSIITQEYHDDGSGKEPRYYQLIAINRTMEAIANGEPRILLVMATGTGKTYTVFQIIWRLWKSGAKKRILFLADRNILVDQSRTNDFRSWS